MDRDKERWRQRGDYGFVSGQMLGVGVERAVEITADILCAITYDKLNSDEDVSEYLDKKYVDSLNEKLYAYFMLGRVGMEHKLRMAYTKGKGKTMIGLALNVAHYADSREEAFKILKKRSLIAIHEEAERLKKGGDIDDNWNDTLEEDDEEDEESDDFDLGRDKYKPDWDDV